MKKADQKRAAALGFIEMHIWESRYSRRCSDNRCSYYLGPGIVSAVLWVDWVNRKVWLLRDARYDVFELTDEEFEHMSANFHTLTRVTRDEDEDEYEDEETK